MTPDNDHSPARTALIVAPSSIKIWGMTSTERLRRQLGRAGAVVGAEAAPDEDVVVLRADFAFEQRLIEALVERPGVVLMHGDTPAAANVKGRDAAAVASALSGEAGAPALGGLAPLDSEGLGGSYNRKLRKREIAYLIPLSPQTVQDVENRSFAGSYKGVTDFVTKYVWPKPAQIVTKWCAVTGITPNQVTLFGFVLVIAAFWLFWTGNYWPGLACAWLMTFLDTVDGKLARVTLTYSKVGDIMDHGIDLVHPPFWWWAWIVGLPAAGDPMPYPELMIAIIFIGYIVQRIEEGVFLRMFGMHMHVWRPFDSFFRLITARRNPNLVILTIGTILFEPDIGMQFVVAWIVLCLIVHLAQIVQAAIARRDGPVTSWLSA